MNKEERMNERTQSPWESFAQAEFMEEVIKNQRGVSDAQYWRLTTGEKESQQPQPEKNMHFLDPN